MDTSVKGPLISLKQKPFLNDTARRLPIVDLVQRECEGCSVESHRSVTRTLGLVFLGSFLLCFFFFLVSRV